MGIIVNLDVMMAKRKISLGELSQRVDVTMANLSILKNNKAKAVRFSTLEAICKALDCQPGDILEYVPADEDEKGDFNFSHSRPADFRISGMGAWVGGAVDEPETGCRPAVRDGQLCLLCRLSVHGGVWVSPLCRY